MKTMIFSLVIVLMLVMMACSHAADLPPEVAQPSGWPTTWTGLTTDDPQSGCNAHRNVEDVNGDGYALYYAADSQYLYLRMETATAPGWNSTGSQDVARYKWWFCTAEPFAYVSGTSVYDAEFLLILEDRTDTSDVDGNRDLLGELTLMDDLANIGFATRWNQGNKGWYITNTPGGNGPSSLWKRELGTGTAGTGGPQGVMGADIGYRIDNATTGGNFVDMYISWAVLENTSACCLIWATDNQNINLDQAPNCDRPTQTSCLSVCVPPIAAFNATPTSGCAPLTVNFTDQSTGNITSWGWTFGDGGTSTLQNPSHQYTSAGSYNVTLTVSVACGSDNETKTNYITVYARPTATASSNSPVCEGSTIVLTGGPNGMSSYSWTGPNSFNSSSQSPTIPNATTSNAGTYYLTVTYGGCTSDPANTMVVVGTKPTAITSSNSPICEGSTIVLTGGPGGMASYSWTGPNGFSSSSQSPTIPNATTSNAGTYYLTVTYGGCTSDPANTTVVVGTKPTATASSNSPICEGSTIVLTGGPGGMTSYSWTGPNGFSSSSQSPTIPNATTSNAGTYYLTVTYGGCTSDPTNTTVVVGTKPTATASSNSPVSEGATIQLYGGPNGMTSYSWTGPGGWTSSLQNPIRSSATLAMAGTYTLTVTNSNGCTDDESTSVTVSTTELPNYPVRVCVCCELMIASTEGGSVTTPGEGKIRYDRGTVVDLVASPDAGYKFVKWSGDVDLDCIADVHNASTTIRMCSCYSITAIFETAEVTTPVYPTVIIQVATDITTNSATLNMNYTMGDLSQVELRFAYKKSTDLAWSYTAWVSKTADGTHAEVLTGLDSDTTYGFKAQLKGSATVESTTLQFTTDKSSTPPPSAGWCFIATAAYGTPTAEQIDVLREFRDTVLLESTAGSQFVALYYQLSPPVADFIAGNEFLRTLVRELLVDPIVWVVEVTGDIWRN